MAEISSKVKVAEASSSGKHLNTGVCPVTSDKRCRLRLNCYTYLIFLCLHQLLVGTPAASKMIPPKTTTGSSAPPRSLPKHELLHRLRGIQEGHHWQQVYFESAHAPWLCNMYHQPIDFENKTRLRIEDANGACNRTAPVFILRDEQDPLQPNKDLRSRLFPTEVFLSELYNYTYQRWFRPYKSEIDRNQFLTKVNLPPPAPLPDKTCSQAMVDWIKLLNANFCARVKETKANEIGWDEEHADEPLYYLQPLFEAISIAIRASEFTLDTSDFPKIPVLISRTGNEEALSAPVTFESIAETDKIDTVADDAGDTLAVETTLEAAVTFLMYLEQREAAVYGMKPDPMESTRDMSRMWVDKVAEYAPRLGWDEKEMGPLRGPSSIWVDTSIYRTWSGQGFDSVTQFANMRRIFRGHAEARMEMFKSRGLA